jgi:hypothetical protein
MKHRLSSKNPVSFSFLGTPCRHRPSRITDASSQRPIAVFPLGLQDYFTAPVGGAFEHLVCVPCFVEPEHFANFGL